MVWRKNQVSIPIIEKVMIILLILWRPFCIFRSKRIFKKESSTSAQILLWGAIHAQSKEKQTFISIKKRLPPYRTTLILQTKNAKKHTLHPRILGVRDRETSFAAPPPKYTRGLRLKG